MRTISTIILSLITIAIHGQNMLTRTANAFTGTDRLQMRQVSCVDCREDSLCWDFSNMETMNPKYTVWHVDKSDSLQQVTAVVERGTRHTYRQQGDSLLISGYVNMRLIDRENGFVEIINDKSTDYDWNRGGNSKRDWFVKVNNSILGIDPAIHGFKTYYYGFGILNQ